jgi:uncharacterized LabA/DUF88 family protein
MNNSITDRTWQPDYGRLHAFVCGTDKHEIGAAKLWGSPPPYDSFWERVKQKGFAHHVYERNCVGKEKKVDVDIACTMMQDAYTIIQNDKNNSEICLVAGDSDFVPAISKLINEGFKVELVFWEHAAKELIAACSHFTCLNPHLEYLTLQQGRRNRQ